jgi:hypothetical protein
MVQLLGFFFSLIAELILGSLKQCPCVDLSALCKYILKLQSASILFSLY